MAQRQRRRVSRREMLTGLAAGAGSLGLPQVEARRGDGLLPARKLEIVVAGAHPDDPELGAGGDHRPLH